MKKLLDREPTEEMLRIVDCHEDGTYRFTSLKAMWQAMFDAAPEVKGGMEPVAEIAYYEPDDGADGTDGEIYILPAKNYAPKVGDKFYSAAKLAEVVEANVIKGHQLEDELMEKLATLQAENERLTAERCERKSS